MNALKKKGYFWVTFILFLMSIIMHWSFAWQAYKNDQKAHHQPIDKSEYIVEVMRDTMENWQSEFLQLIWQVAGLTYLLYVGSPSSKEGDERIEAKLDYILKKLEPEKASELMQAWEQKYPKK